MAARENITGPIKCIIGPRADGRTVEQALEHPEFVTFRQVRGLLRISQGAALRLVMSGHLKRQFLDGEAHITWESFKVVAGID